MKPAAPPCAGRGGCSHRGPGNSANAARPVFPCRRHPYPGDLGVLERGLQTLAVVLGAWIGTSMAHQASQMSDQIGNSRRTPARFAVGIRTGLRIRVSAGSGRRAAQEVAAVTLCSPQRRAPAATSLQCAQIKNKVSLFDLCVTINYYPWAGMKLARWWLI